MRLGQSSDTRMRTGNEARPVIRHKNEDWERG